MNRRQLLTSAPVLLAGCSGLQTIETNIPVWVKDVTNIGAELSAAANDLKAITGVPAAIVLKVQGWIADAKALALRIGSDVTTAVPSGTLSSFIGSFINIASALSGKVGGTLGMVIHAGLAVLPSILAIAGIALAGPPMQSTMSEAQGRRVLEALSTP